MQVKRSTFVASFNGRIMDEIREILEHTTNQISRVGNHHRMQLQTQPQLNPSCRMGQHSPH